MARPDQIPRYGYSMYIPVPFDRKIYIPVPMIARSIFQYLWSQDLYSINLLADNSTHRQGNFINPTGEIQAKKPVRHCYSFTIKGYD